MPKDIASFVAVDKPKPTWHSFNSTHTHTQRPNKMESQRLRGGNFADDVAEIDWNGWQNESENHESNLSENRLKHARQLKRNQISCAKFHYHFVYISNEFEFQ